MSIRGVEARDFFKAFLLHAPGLSPARLFEGTTYFFREACSMAIPPNRVVVVGCGDHFSSDAAAGLEVAAMLRRMPGHSCEVRDLELCSPQFISELPDESILVFVHGVISSSAPGSIHAVRLTQNGLHGSASTVTLRVWDEVRNLLRLAARIPQVCLIGVEMERTDAGIGITSSVHAAVLEVVRELAAINEKGQPKLPFLTETSSSDYRS